MQCSVRLRDPLVARGPFDAKGRGKFRDKTEGARPLGAGQVVESRQSQFKGPPQQIGQVRG